MNLVELFSSVQGEGLHVGVPTLFVRFGECDLRCAWCDSPGTWLRAQTCRIETEPGSARFREAANPVAVATVIASLRALTPDRHRFASLTGGEPLLQPEAVAELAPRIHALGLRVHLETHGLAHEALARVAADVDCVSMDWKLASDVRRADDPRHGRVEPFHDTHERFLTVARDSGVELVVKVVVTQRTLDEELDEVCARVARVAPDATLVLQPVTPFAMVRERPSAARLLACVRACSEKVDDVRLIPQTHKDVGAL